jgi:D-arginine dehydrogenase
MAQRVDILIVGAGMAGASLAAECARDAKVAIVEREDAPGHHATGRSAAFWEECYGGPGVMPLTLASHDYLQRGGYLDPRGAIYLGRAQDDARLDDFARKYRAAGARIERVGRAALTAQVPGISQQWQGGIQVPACADIDVARLHADYLATARANSAQLQCRAAPQEARREGDVWQVKLTNGDAIEARTIVNAAGAWADQVAPIFGARAIGITPLRRTVVQLRTDPAPDAGLPLLLDIRGGFYFKVAGTRIWVSPQDETPSEPCDAAPEELDVARAIDRFQSVLDWQVAAAERKWAGLRSFAPDRLPVYGPDPQTEGFFWFAGQGGFGIQTAPAAARLAAQILLDRPRDAMTRDLPAQTYAPSRFA